MALRAKSSDFYVFFSLVDSNMFIRCATLTFHKFQRENVDVGESKLLNYMSKQEIRADLIAKLIELITPDTLNQVIFMVSLYKITFFILRKTFLASTQVWSS